MNSKIQKLVLAMCVSALVFHVADSIIFTATGILIDSALAFVFLNSFASLAFFGKRDVSDQGRTRPEEYLRMAFSMDGDKCLPVAICAAVVRSRDISIPLNKFETLVSRTFERKLREEVNGSLDNSAPMGVYLAAAKFGQSARDTDICHQTSPSCSYTLDQIRKVTNLVSKINS